MTASLNDFRFDSHPCAAKLLLHMRLSLHPIPEARILTSRIWTRRDQKHHVAQTQIWWHTSIMPDRCMSRCSKGSMWVLILNTLRQNSSQTFILFTMKVSCPLWIFLTAIQTMTSFHIGNNFLYIWRLPIHRFLFFLPKPQFSCSFLLLLWMSFSLHTFFPWSMDSKLEPVLQPQQQQGEPERMSHKSQTSCLQPWHSFPLSFCCTSCCRLWPELVP